MAVAAEFLTFLFTDLEGSTALWERHAGSMESALAHHDELLRAAVGRCRGTVVKSTGDGIHAVFRSPRDGVRAAIEAQQAIWDAEWPERMRLRVRMGVHAGEAAARDGDWFGTEVNRAARVMAVAHGGQIVCTRIVEELVRDEFDVVDLGAHRLRDLQSTVHLFQIEVPGVPCEHPPLRSIDAHLTNLPYELSSFIGREHELDDAVERLDESRLLSVVGVGGVGKTRFALQVAARLLPNHADGVWLCELGSVADADALHDAVAGALRYTPPPGVPTATGLRQFLEHKDVLLVLDNCEHLISAVATFVTETMTHSPQVSVLVTSREALGVRGERTYPLPSLSLPAHADTGTVLASEAGQLFVSRAQEARGDLELDDRTAASIYSLCTRLDGIPLAIELAAAQTALMTPSEIDRRLDRQFTSVTGGRRGALERHQTLRAAIDWSYELLSASAQTLLGRLSVCAAGFDLDAADALADGIDDGDGFALLGELVAKSLVERYEVDGTTRYRLLEMIRQYAAEKLLASSEADAVRDVHAHHFLDRATTLFGAARSNAEYEVFDHLEVETPNIAAGARWVLATGRTSEVLAFFGALPFVDYFTIPPTTLDELGGIAEDAVAQPGAPHMPGFGMACLLAGFHIYVEGDYDRYRVVADLARATPGPASIGSLVADACIAMFDGDFTGAVAFAGQAVEWAQAEGDEQLVAWTLAHRSVQENVWERATGSDGASPARDHAETALTLARNQQGTTARFYPLLAVITSYQAFDRPRVIAAAEEIVTTDRTSRRWWSTIAMSALVTLLEATEDDQLVTMRNILGEYHEHGERIMLSQFLVGTAEVLAQDLPELAIDLAAIAESGAVAPNSTFSTRSILIDLAAANPGRVGEARARAATMSYDAAARFVLGAFDLEIEKRRIARDESS